MGPTWAQHGANMGAKRAPRSVQGGSNCSPEGVISSDCSPTAHMDPTWTPYMDPKCTRNEHQMNPKLGSCWDHLGVVLGSSWGHLGVILGSSWGRLGVILGSSWCHLGVILGSSWVTLGSLLRSLWDHIGITLGSLWHRSGTTDFHQNGAEQILALESRSRAISWGKIRRISSSTRSDWSWGTKRGWRQRATPLGMLV